MKCWTRWALYSSAALLFISGCGKEAEPEAAEQPTPVTYVELKLEAPEVGMRIAGVAASWSEQDIAFEVGGTLEYVVEAGEQYLGGFEDGERLGVIARLDPTPYQTALEIAQAEVASQRRTIEQVLPARLDQINAEIERTRVDYENTRDAFERNAAAPRDLAAAKSAYDAAQAQLAEAQAELEVQLANLDITLAKERNAQRDLDNCVLYAPFPGELSEVFAVAGGTVSAGTAVAHLVMMDPVVVRISVSPEDYRSLYENDTVLIYPPGGGSAQVARVYEKGVSADPATRTFQVTLISPNQQVDEPINPDAEALTLPRIQGLFPVIDPLRHEQGAEVTPYVESRRCIYEDADGQYVWLAQGLTVDTGLPEGDPVVTLRKTYITLGEKRANYQGIYIFREVLAPTELQPRMLVATGVPDGFPDGGRAAWIRQRWLIQPGESLEVKLQGAPTPAGFYLPFDAVVRGDDGGQHVFIIGDDDKAERVAVTIDGEVGELVRVTGEALNEGARVVVRGAHLVQPGELVTATPEAPEATAR